ncbi:hypothetical protein Vid5_gp21 [Pantoea phage vB_PagS_Vid5]|uniref:DUF6950 domain-containing protein n=1 Tax=Pantoea phage vB_PagS_Vid5 TaxID=2099652 RepID=A0A2P1CKK9_9CAUD|nr:hypothetical protein FDJ45_gp021 [Pantoea phage vB_PagS_Vid5]AVJ51776.1 hypothetical protein Vid5_gp21 [Pantoea phage vB_PagS_Vid5]
MKKHNWQTDFLKMVGEKATEPFAWGSNDCAMFAADAVLLICGTDFAKEFRGKYKTEVGAKRSIAKQGGMIEVLNGKLEAIHPNFAQRGDVVLFDGELGATLGIYWNGGVFAAGPDGIVLFDEIHDKITNAWRV